MISNEVGAKQNFMCYPSIGPELGTWKPSSRDVCYWCVTVTVKIGIIVVMVLLFIIIISLGLYIMVLYISQLL